ncbi:myelin expression factor 2 isoform X2 [Callorhinchus milii]|uniref:Myelin expression factor 2-like protein n=1 Tax=Callorhinchus milii TaxID=7868 RepID=V9KKW2_CALMI|nr:myelin expression factor 2 isoform X2 [Callorhinchus milii]|eukprot:gi/632938219/ref/XP_007904166.1/ PREDICTED: myelin expression factor 2 isoform X2 [Callorhinchus milii]
MELLPWGVRVSEEDESSKEETSSLKEKSIGIKKSNRFHPYSKEKTANGDKKGYNRNRVFISNIPYDMKWQAIKDLMREKVGEVTYVELFKDAEGKSRGCGVVEFKTEDFVNKAMDIMNKFDLSGRPLTIKEDPDGEHARRAMQRGSYPGVLGLDMGSPIVNLPPNIVNNPNIPSEVITALQGGRLGTTVFVANLDFKVGWKKLKEVFCMAGVVKRADIKEDKDGKSRGIGTVTFDQSIEAVQAISMFNGQLLFDRPMHVKMDDKSVPHDDYRVLESKSQQLPRGLAGIGMGLGPGGQPIAANQMNSGMGNMGSGGIGMDGPVFGGMNRMGGGGMSGPSGFGSGMDAMNNMGGYGGGSMSGIGNMGRMGGMGPIDDFRGNLAGGMGNMGGNMGGMGSNMSGFGATGSSVGGMGSNMGDMYRPGMGSGAMGGSFDRDFGRNDMGMNRGFGESFGGMGGGMGGGLGGNLGGGMATTSMGPIGSGMGGGMAGMNSMGGVMGMGMDRMGSNLDRMGSGMGVGLDRNMDMDRGFGNLNTGSMGSGLRERGSGFRGCQIFARNLPYDLPWQKLKEKFSQCGHVMFAEIKMENGMSKGCGTVLFDTPEAAEKACRLMNGTKITGREIDVRLDRNA